ncbi:MAG: hypothetical protein V7K88_28320 [Nostoc sp.]
MIIYFLGAAYAQEAYEQSLSSIGDREGSKNGGRTYKAPAC